MWCEIIFLSSPVFRWFQVMLCSSLNKVLICFDLSHRNKDSECHLQVSFGSGVKLGSPGYLVELEDMVASSCLCHSLAKVCNQREFEESCSYEFSVCSGVQATPPFAGEVTIIFSQWQQYLLAQLEKVLALQIHLGPWKKQYLGTVLSQKKKKKHSENRRAEKFKGWDTPLRTT